ncbi:hypothetical protein SOM08_07065 [Hydrogenophaga sp. SNF1]|uniref:hypothetical protein n=1 Tax=Hydrogenophaga sp. SNF1 TaxID=3098762 RepID=UPI002ACC0FE1|nr:hypothetical protein [Hydrogenophaga sp. SNF1]WQB85069.1 hypothetical protein SOM08_07065 [Hydrogenophaga sp. SNF1]
MPVRNTTTAHLPLPTNHVFHDSPVGKFHRKSRAATVLPSQAKRTGWDKVAHGIARGWNRFLNAMTPGGVRVDPKYRHALKDTSRAVGDLLGNLIHPQGKLSPTALKKAFGSIENAAAPVTQRGVPFDQLLTKRFEVHLAQLTPAELKTLRTQLQVLVANGTDAAVEPHLKRLSQALSAEVERRVFADCRTQLLPRLQEAIAEAQQQSPRAPDTYNSLSGVVKNIMGTYGMNHAAKYKDETRLALSVLGAALNGFLGKGDVCASDIKTLLHALPSDDQAALQAADSAHWVARSTDLLDTLIADVAMQGQRHTQEGFLAAAHGALLSLSHPGQVDAPGLRRIVDAAGLWKALQKHHGAHGLSTDPQVTQAFEAIVHQLPRLVLHRAALDDLSAAELPALSKALTTFGNTQDVSTVAQAIDERQAWGVRECHEALQPALDPLHTGDLRASLNALAAAQKVLTKVKIQQELLKGLNQTGADDVRDFEYGVYEPLFANMATEPLQTHAQALASPATQRLVETLRGMGQDLWNASGGDETDPRFATAEQLLGISQTLMQLADSANRAQATRTGVEAPAAPEYDASQQDPDVRHAVNGVFQIPPN